MPNETELRLINRDVRQLINALKRAQKNEARLSSDQHIDAILEVSELMHSTVRCIARLSSRVHDLEKRLGRDR